MGEYTLDAVLSAVADPTRRAILDRLLDGDARVTDLAREFPISLNSTSKHIKVLERAELVHRDVRGREHVLSLRAQSLGNAVAWMERYRAFWEERLAALEAFVTSDEADVAQAVGVPQPVGVPGGSGVAVGDAPGGDEATEGGAAR
ncbi:ArsR/SmtB family transcription factor [Agromyces sp. NPDC058110]|uniref:ArsR/SmtB family transcription factor n=1 Tax=Agromyces sp. NPDC058110 TaxID=3346345 RepID=UPI0036DE7D4A